MNNTPNNFETPLQRANRLKSIGQEIEPRIDRVWTLGEIKDLSMETGGLFHDAAELVAHGIEPTKENIEKFKTWLVNLYTIKQDHQNIIKDK